MVGLCSRIWDDKRQLPDDNNNNNDNSFIFHNNQKGLDLYKGEKDNNIKASMHYHTNKSRHIT